MSFTVPPGKRLGLSRRDDFGYECVTANGGESYQTPNLDRLAAGGMRFTNCFVQPLCTPTRVQMMTGLYNVRNYVRFGLLDPQAVTFGHLMKEAGYATGIVGKWQLGQEKNLPQHFGFDEAYLWQHTRRPPRYANPGLEYNGEERDFTGGEYGPDLVQDFALDFITRHKDRPFFLYYPMMLTHAPFQPTPDSPDWDPKQQGEQGANDLKHFAEMVAYMDKQVGELNAKLDELEIRDDTLVLFLGDNGTGKGVTTTFKGQPYPGGKGTVKARGTHVPLIACWPGNVPAGKVNGQVVGATDFLPTLCAAAGVAPPQELDGRSFLAQLRGAEADPKAVRYSWYGQHGGPTATSESAMTATHKLYRDGRLFDLAADPFEEQPIAAGERDADDAAAAAALEQVLAKYAGARPERYDVAQTPPRRARRRAGRNNRAARQQAPAAAAAPTK
jgi:arylsulfatase A